MLHIIVKFLYMFKSPQNGGPGDALSSDAGGITSNGTILENILAFRTITTILSMLPRTTPIEVIDNLESNNILNSQNRQEVRITDAFAHIAAGEHNIAAITTSSIRDDTDLHVLACTNNPITPLPISTPANLITKLKVWYSVRRFGPVRSHDPQRHVPKPGLVHSYHKKAKIPNWTGQDRSFRSMDKS